MLSMCLVHIIKHFGQRLQSFKQSDEKLTFSVKSDVCSTILNSQSTGFHLFIICEVDHTKIKSCSQCVELTIQEPAKQKNTLRCHNK